MIFKEMDQIKGKKSNEISTILGFVREDEIIHKDNMVASRWVITLIKF